MPRHLRMSWRAARHGHRRIRRAQHLLAIPLPQRGEEPARQQNHGKDARSCRSNALPDRASGDSGNYRMLLLADAVTLSVWRRAARRASVSAWLVLVIG